MKKEFVIERLIESNEELRTKYSTEHSLFDFYPGEYVKCTFKDGPAAYFKVYGIDGEDVIVSQVDDLGDLELIKPKFLKKIRLDSNWIKILYS